MKRKFKSLGVVLAAVFAMSAIGASAASAAEFHASTAPITVTGTQTTGHVFTTNAGTVTCKVATFSGTQGTKTTSTVTLAPNYDQCTAFGFINVPIHENGCAYKFNINGTTEVECGAKPIEITAPGCTTTVGSQHIASGMSYATAGATPNRHITATTNIVSEIDYNECGNARTNGSYKGTTTVDGPAGTEIWRS